MYEDWNRHLNENLGSPALVIRSETHGLGDKLGGVATGAFYAMKYKRPMHVVWPGGDTVFEFPKTFPKKSCTFKNYPGEAGTGCFRNRAIPGGDKCQEYMSESHIPPSCWNDKELHVKGQRMCVEAETCARVEESNKRLFNAGGASLIQTLGCSLRLTLNPLNSFLDRPLDWFIQGKVVKSSIRQVRTFLDDYTTISFQFRFGDMEFRKNRLNISSAGKIPSSRRIVTKSLACGDSLYESVKKSTNKPLIYLFASDSLAERVHMQQTYGDKLVMLVATPTHISDDKLVKQNYKRSNSKYGELSVVEDIAQLTAAEWMMIGVGDFVVIDSPMGRVSWFPYTSLMWNLKPYAYIGSSCKKVPVSHRSEFNMLNKEWYASACRKVRGYDNEYDFLS